MGFIPEETIARVLERTDIVQTISAYIPLKRAGRNFKAPCPFHNEKTPSFVVNPDKQIFHCFGCGVGGNAVTFVMKQEHLQFPEAIRMMADKAGIDIPKQTSESPKKRSLKQAIYHVNKLAAEFFHSTLVSAKDKDVDQAREYLKARDVSLEIVKKFKLGFAPNRWDSLLLYLKKKDVSLSLIEKAGLIVAREKKDGYYDRFRNRITFPIFDKNAHCIGFGARALDDGMAKYINSPETEVYTKGRHLYGFHIAKDAVSRQDQIIVVEGYMDFIMPFQAGVNNIVASLGTALTPDQIRIIRRYTKNVVMLFDTDQAGESAMIRSLDLLIEEGMNVKVASLDQGDDPDSFIRKHGLEAFEKRINDADSVFDFKLQTLLESYDKRTVEGRARISGQMLSTINKFENAIIKSEYLKRLAQSLNLSHEAIMIEFKKLSQGSDARKVFKNISHKKNVSIKERAAEYNVLRILLEDQDLIEATKDEVDLSDLQDENIREIIGKIYELYEENSEVNAPGLMSCFDDQRILQIISGVLAEDKEPIHNIEKMHSDCIMRIRNDRVKLKRQDLLGKIRQAEIAGQVKALEKLKEEFNKLMKK